MKRASVWAVLGLVLMVGATTVAWTGPNLAVEHEVSVLIGIPGAEGHKYKVTVSEEQFKDMFDGSAVVLKVDGAEQDLVAQVTMKEKKSRKTMSAGGASGGSAGGDSGW